MKVLGVNEINSYRHKAGIQQSKPAFRALFGNLSADLSLQGKFEYGLKALKDEKTILVVTNDKSIADYTLKEHSKDISIPIEKMYRLEFPKVENEDYINFVV